MSRMSAARSKAPANVSRYVALLRAINVGGHLVKMDRLRGIFESLTFVNVETFIASGNVIFESPVSSSGDLERTIEERLKSVLGYPVGTFVRTPAEMIAAAAHAPFDAAEVEGAGIYVAFVKTPLDKATRQQILALETDLDAFDVRGREVYWLRRNMKARAGEPFPPLERVLRTPATTRNITTVRKLAAKYCADLAVAPTHPPARAARKTDGANTAAKGRAMNKGVR
jgi:uncharacterized protein (DUF1697 family)